MLPCLAVMARAPVPGDPAIKSRLSGVLPDPGARVALYSAFLRDTLAVARQLPDVSLRVAGTPAGALDLLAASGADRGELIPQRGADLGDRERNLFRDLFALGFDPVVLIGSDLPSLPASCLRAAFDALRDSPSAGRGPEPPAVAVGPSHDGGYYLLGLRSPAPGTDLPDLFTGIRWSTPHAFEDTLAAAARAGLAVRRTPAWYDVDDEAGLARLRRDLSARPDAAPATAAALGALGL